MLTIYSSLTAALLLVPAAAQIFYPVCSSSWSWSFNSFGQSPCEVAGILQGVCDNGDFSIPPLVPGDSYTGPTGTGDETDLCKCNTVVYSLMSACDACQFEDATWFSWKTWSTNCSAVDPPSTYSNTIPNMTAVPAWAFNDVTKGTWDPVLAYQVGDSPEVAGDQSGTLSPLPSPTTTQTSVPGLSDSQAQFAKGKGHHANRAAIIGGFSAASSSSC
ncbi:hypothetical protein BGY98DRAFT_43922 [Russula aff. rugulosa BPL654]|nr:hypothetical protein BGY98DRAFT_43922 [Russula aff. rugulosa BPL654]